MTIPKGVPYAVSCVCSPTKPDMDLPSLFGVDGGIIVIASNWTGIIHELYAELSTGCDQTVRIDFDGLVMYRITDSTRSVRYMYNPRKSFAACWFNEPTQAKPIVDLRHFPHRCTRCGKPSYNGLFEIAHHDEIAARDCPARRK